MNNRSYMFGLRVFALISAIFILCQPVSAPFAVAGEGWDYWNEFVVKKPLKENLKLRLKAEQRFRDDFAENYLTNYEIGFLFKPTENFEIGPLYKYEHEKSPEGEWTDENRFSLEGTYKWAVRDIRLSNRHRFNYRDVSGKTSWRYRFKLKASRPVTTVSFQHTPFISEEIFYDNAPEEINQNRLSIGFSKRLMKSFELEIFYMLKSKLRRGKWGNVNVFGTTFAISL